MQIETHFNPTFQIVPIAKLAVEFERPVQEITALAKTLAGSTGLAKISARLDRLLFSKHCCSD